MPEWIYVIRATREGFVDGPNETEQQVMADHFDYLKRLLDNGQLVLAGPALDATFGITIFEAEDEAAAREIMESDPSVVAGVMNATLHPYRASLLRGRDG